MSINLNEQFEQLYNENLNKVYRLALALTGNTSDAEEITQEAFFRAFRSFDCFRKESSFFTWIYRITVNVANDYMKERNKTLLQMLTEDFGYGIEDIIDTNPDNNPETELLAKEVTIKCLYCLTEYLPINQRKVFCLAITIGLPHKVVAEILGCSLSTVKTTLYRAKKRWFDYMENRCGLMKKSNPCHCNQWVRFGKEQGWLFQVENPVIQQSIEELVKLRNLRNIYQAIYQETMDEVIVQRIKEGIKNKEWQIIS